MQQQQDLAPHVNEIARALQNKLEMGAIEDELRRYLEYGVPLNQAKRDIVRMHGGSLVAGAKKIADLQPEDKGVDLEGRILTVNPKEITVKGQPKQIFFGFFADDTGKVSYTAWKDHNLQRGANVRIKNAYAKKGFRDPVELNIGDFATITVVDKLPFEPREDLGPAGTGGPTPGGDYGGSGSGAGSRVSTERTIKELHENVGNVTVTGRILDVREKVISTANGQKTLVEGELADESGRVAFSAWEPEKLPAEFKADAVVRIRNAYVKTFRGTPQLNVGQYATIDVLPATTLPERRVLLEPKPFTLGDLERAGGATGIVIEGVVLDVKKGSGLIFRCAQENCNRVLQKMECRLHGKQKGVPDLRIKAILNDGHGAATFFANREATERILEKGLDECQALAREAMTVDVIQDEITAKLTARRVAVVGNASSDEFGLQIIASDVRYLAARTDITSEAEKLLGHLGELSTEVA